MKERNDAYDFDAREHPDRYRVGRGEQGVLSVEPYKGELLPHWRFKTPAEAEASSVELLRRFYAYLDEDDFVGADMARKFLQMGWTRARRYANHRSGRKYDPESGEPLPRDPDPQKAEAARIFYERYVEAREDARYRAAKDAHRARYG